MYVIIVRVCMYMNACEGILTRMCVCMYMNAYESICMNVNMASAEVKSSVYVCVCMYMNVHECMCICEYDIFRDICMYAKYQSSCMHVCMNVCMYVCECDQC